MTPPAIELLKQLRDVGADPRVEDGKLWIKAPPGVLTDELKAAITDRKLELTRILTSHPCTECGRFLFSEPTVCFWCRPPQRRKPLRHGPNRGFSRPWTHQKRPETTNKTADILSRNVPPVDEDGFL